MDIAPLLPVAAGMIVGVALDPIALWPPWAYVVVVVAAGALCAHRETRRRAGCFIVLIAATAVGGALHHGAARSTSASSVERFAADGGVIARIRGAVASPPQLRAPQRSALIPRAFQSNRTMFLLAVDAIHTPNGFVSADGLVRVTVREAVPDLTENERVELFGRLWKLTRPDNPGAFDWSAYHRRHGIVAGLTCRHRENVIRQPAETAGWWRRLVSGARARVRGLLVDDLAADGEHRGGLLEAMVLGHRSTLDRRLNDVFIRSGCIHFLAVSGLHLVIVMFLARIACVPLALRPRSRTVVMLLAVVAYVVIAEPRPSILRAGVIAVIYCVGKLLGREGARLNWISATAIVLAVVDPQMVFDVGYQLSSAAVLGVAFLAPALRQIGWSAATALRGATLGRRRTESAPDDSGDDPIAPQPAPTRARRAAAFVRRYLVTALCLSLGAWLASLPIAAYAFHQAHPWSAMNAVVVMPVVTLLMAIGFAKLVAGVLFPTLASALAEPLAIGEAALTRLVGVLAELPGASMDISPPPGWVIGAYYLFLLTCVLWSAGRRRTRAADAAPTRLSNAPPVHVPAAAVAGSLAIVVLSIALWMRPLPPAGRLRVTALAVGAGSASVLEMPEGQTVLFDAGTLGPQNIARHVLLPFLRLRGIARIDRTYISHANIDHFNALPELAESIPVGPIHVNRYFREHCRTRAPGRRMLSMLEGRGHELRTLDPAVRVWEYGGARFEMLSPRCASPSGNGIDCPPLTSNNASTVLRVTYAGGSILLTGDIERQTESALIAESEIHADVMVLPHHGAVNAATAPFIAAVGADVLIRSSRERMSETLNGLAALTGGSLLLNTADVGAVTVEIDADGLRVRSVHGGAHRPPTNGDDVAPAPTHSADEVPVTSSHTP